MSKGSGSTRKITAKNAGNNRTFDIKIQSVNDAINVLEKYKKYDNVPSNMKVKLSNDYSQFQIENFSKKKAEYDKLLQDKFQEALTKGNKKIYDDALDAFNAKVEQLNKEQQLLVDKWSKFMEK